ncbi:hypothetical protein ACFPRA_07110 [Sporosarcina soli]|uniref:Uncharacterized protein n=1 Tax=Sporosarcina soli TaxID=334736 RepID=A0ABW0TI32_9BACL
MSNLNQINHANLNGDHVHFTVAEKTKAPEGKPAGKMITDSDEFSFVYLFDVEDGYTYYHFPQAVWPMMVEALKADVDPILSWDDGEVTLNGFKEELTMLIFNIEGNDNYGESFSTAVEQTFSSILQNAE